MKKPYYFAYESRYQKVFAAGIETWGHSPDDKVLASTLKKWVLENNLVGKKVLDFACGEGACGVILSQLGCHYHGVDIAPSAVEKAQSKLKEFPNAKVSLLDMVNEIIDEEHDAAVDCMGYHMLVTDSERNAYLKNAFNSLKSRSPMLFFRQSYNENAYDGVVDNYEQWKEICDQDYETPILRSDKTGKEVWIPLVPARSKNKEGYLKEMQNAGFIVEKFINLHRNNKCLHSANIFVRKP